MTGEIDLYGVFIPSLLVWVGASLPLTAGLRRLLRWFGFYRLVWHRPLFDFALLVIVRGAVVAISTRWIAHYEAVAPRPMMAAAALLAYIGKSALQLLEGASCGHRHQDQHDVARSVA